MGKIVKVFSIFPLMIFFLRKMNPVLAAFCCMALLSCKFEFWKETSPVIAEVESTRLYVNELREIKDLNDNISKEEWVRRIDNWVNLEVMYREALKRGLHKDSVTQKLIRDAERKILVDRLKLTMDSTVSVDSDKELQEYYESNMELFLLDSASYIPFEEVIPQIRSAVLSEKRLKKERKWLTETKNNYSIEVYPQYLDSL